MEIYSIEDLSFSYPKTDTYTLKDISFSVSEGEFITICGLSGSGKSTFLRHLKTSLKPYGKVKGVVEYKGKPLNETDELTQASEIGFVMQSPDNQSITDKVWHELAFGLESLGLDNSAIRRKTAEMAAFFGMNDWLYKKVRELSGGQKQILNLASVMIMQPSVLILDEPTAQLDPIAADEFVKLLKNINNEFGTTVILSEHSLDNVYSISDRIIVMSDGRIISDSTPKETAKILYRKKDVMFSALPVSARVYVSMEEGFTDTPLTAGEGRAWLKEYVKDKELSEIRHDKTEHDKKEAPMLELKKLWYRYDKNLPDILKGLSLKAYKGEIFSILGSNGAGKTTLLNSAVGLYKPYSGKILLNGSDRKKQKANMPKTVLLPQNPQALFVKDTVEDDLYEIFTYSKENREEKKYFVESMIKLCGLENLRKRHPYDLSGGEQQKAALAKILLTRPDILLLDEPVKGLDVRAKREIGEILRILADMGACIIMVSHDMDFCAEYSDRCALFFGGELIGTDAPHIFFSENTFYTTAARRMSRDIIENAVTADDILSALRKNKKSDGNRISRNDIENIYSFENVDDKPEKKKISVMSVLRKFSFLLFVLSVISVLDLFDIPYVAEHTLISYIIMLVSAAAVIFLGIKSQAKSENIVIQRIHRQNKITILSIVLIFLAIPLTIFIGIYFFNDSKYLFISLLIMLECMLPFFTLFERQHIKTRELVLIAVMCALSVTSRAAFYMFPQFKPMTAFIIISGTALGAESGFLVGAVSMLVSNVIFGQGPWTPWQMFTMGIIGFLSGLFFGRNIIPRNKLSFSVFGFLAALLIYGGIMDPAAMIMSHIEPTYENVKAYYLTGLPLDIIHAISTSVFLYFASEAIIKKLERVKLKYGLYFSEA